ncbi:MAG: VWA domain-containing protein [Acidobacteriota bacterium]
MTRRSPLLPILVFALLSIPPLVGLGAGPAGASDAPLDNLNADQGEGTIAVDEKAEEVGTTELPKAASRWLQEVEPIITAAERALFVGLAQEYQRKAFIHQFWKVRDPYPRTARNEMKERWPLRIAEARNTWGSLQDDRSRMLLVHGEPAATLEVKCTQTRKPAEVWFYRGTDWTDINTAVIFIKPAGVGEARIWRPGSSGALFERAMSRARGCINGSQLMQVASIVQVNQTEYETQLQRLLAKPRPRSTEWVYTFKALSTDLPPGTERLEGELDLAFPGRHQHRTVVQGTLTLDAADIGTSEYAGYRSHDFRLTGEVLRGEDLFETFRYKFGVPADVEPPALPLTQLPLAFQRYLRPGSYRLILKLEDLNSPRAYREEREIEVPQVDQIADLPTFRDPETEALFAEATAAVEAGETGIRIVPPQGELQTGFTRFDTLASGDAITKVRFYLDDKLVLTKNRPPYNVSLDLGAYPDLHTLRAEALDAEGEEVASDELLINSGGYRFVAKLREPRAGKTYTNSLRAQVDVEVPDGRSLDRVELFLNETLVATLYQEPFVHPMVLPSSADIAYVRAVAYLGDGNATEDLVFINAPDDFVEEVEVQFVELYTTVLGPQGRPVDGLERNEVKVLEDGVPQTIARFETVEDLPIHVGVLIDNSASMVGVLEEVRRAALGFLQSAVTPKDRAAVITFNNFPDLAVELTNDKTALGAGLAGLAAEGKTALYDSVMFSLYYFTGIKGQRAVLVLSDGKDESSRFGFEETLEYARRAGITVYTIGLRLGDLGARRKLERLADETGGRSFFLRDISDLDSVYGDIQRELRSQLLIAYQSSNTADDGEFRQVELEVARPGVTVKTLSGYYP